MAIRHTCCFLVASSWSKEPGQQRVKRWAFGIDEVLKDPVGREQFLKFLESEFSSENLRYMMKYTSEGLIIFKTKISSVAIQCWAELSYSCTKRLNSTLKISDYWWKLPLSTFIKLGAALKYLYFAWRVAIWATLNFHSLKF